MRRVLAKILPNENVDLLLRQMLLVLTIMVVANFVAVNFWSLSVVLLFDLGLVLLLLIFRFPLAAFYVMMFLYPFSGWLIRIGSFDAPAVDWLGLVLLLVWSVRIWFMKKEAKIAVSVFPMFVFAFIFMATAALSLLAAENMLQAVKYLIRPIMFFYLVFLVLPFNFIKKDKILNNVWRVLLIAGLVVALIGLLSLVFGPDARTFSRVQPFVFGELNLVGGNHNAIAETMIVTWPIALLLMLGRSGYRKQNLYLIAVGVLILTLLLTFSRSGYIALLLQLLILFLVTYKEKINFKWLITATLAFVIIPLIVYSSVWQNVSWVKSSNYNRLILSEIAWNAFLESPWIGHGPGSFQNIVARTFVFVVDFGDPLDSHGFVQKVLVEQGVIGLTAFVAFILAMAAVFWLAWKKEKTIRLKQQLLCLFLIYIGIIIFELFSTSYYLSRVWVPIGVALAAVAVYKNEKSQELI